jgi:hypothetical protein
MMTGEPQIDLEKRTVNCTVTTNSSPAIWYRSARRHHHQVLRAEPVVRAEHNGPVIGRSLGLTKTPLGMDSITQFAETDTGRDYAYLYGCNEKHEVFMRAWSFGWRSLVTEIWGLDRARQYLGSLWDDETAIGVNDVWVSVRSEMNEYSVVPVGADREALSRAFGGGVRSAGAIIAGMDLTAAQRQLNTLEDTFKEFVKTQEDVRTQIAQLQKDIQALRGDGSAAAARGDSAEILNAVRELHQVVCAKSRAT